MGRFMALLASLASMALMVGIFATPASAQDNTRIILIHGIPGVDVDILANGEPVAEEFGFGDRIDLSDLAGETLEELTVLVAGSDAVAIAAGDVLLPNAGNTTVLAHLDEIGDPTLTLFSNDTSAISAGEGRLTFRHAAAAGPVDIKIDDAPASRGLDNAREIAADLRARDVAVEVLAFSEDGGETVIIPKQDVPVTEGESIVVYVVGSPGDNSVTVLTDVVSLSAAEEDSEATTDQGTEDEGETDEGTDDDGDDEDTAMNSAPAGVETGNSPLTETSIPLSAIAAVVVLAGLMTFGARRFTR